MTRSSKFPTAALLFTLVALCWSPGIRAQQKYIAYEIPAGALGNQEAGGSLGMDFNVDLDIQVTRLGVFDSGSDGLNLPITARLYDRDAPDLELASLVFDPADPGDLVGGSRFKDLDSPVDLPAGFHGSIVAEGYGAGEPNGNQGVVNPPQGKTTNGGLCAVSFVGTGRFGDPGFFPGTPDAGPINRYAAGTFEYLQQDVATPIIGVDTVALDIPELTAGNQNFGGTLGMDFDVHNDVLVNRLGVFDDNSDGIFLPINARLYNRATLTEITRLDFTTDDAGELVGGNRFKDLPAPIGLPAGFQGTIVAEGYGNAERNANTGAVDLGFSIHTAGCAIQFVGSGRFGTIPGGYPDTPDGGPVNRYGAGTFEFAATATAVTKPSAPTGLSAIPGDGEVRLTWTAPGGPPIAGYNVFLVGQGLLPRKLNPAPVTGTQFVAINLVNGSEQCFVVRSILANNLESDPSNQVCATPFTLDPPDQIFVAYDVPAGTIGNQNAPVALGMDFDVKVKIILTSLGVFDSGSDGLNRTITARLYDRTTLGEIASLEFTPEAPGQLIGGSRFKSLPSLISFPPGFHGTIVAEGYGDEELNGNRNLGPLDLFTHNANCSISFTGSRNGPAGTFPLNFEGASPFQNVFAAGTFQYGPEQLPPPAQPGGIAYVVPAGTAGSQAYGGSLGMDFNVEGDIRITRLGVFDSLSDGLLMPITAYLYDRDTQLSIASLEFIPGDDGELVDGSRFKDLDPPLCLPGGFRATMVASGYGADEMNGNLGVSPVPISTNDGGCLISFVGAGRFGDDPTAFPGTADAGPPNRYAAGTFKFESSPTQCVLPPGPPVNFTLNAGANSVLLTWLAPTSAFPAVKYRISRSVNGGAFGPLAEVTELSYTDNAVTAGVDHCYAVRSVGANDEESVDAGPACTTPGASVPGRIIAYQTPGGTLGNNTNLAGEAYGLDFDVNLDITVTRLGVFDDGSNGLNGVLVSHIYDRDDSSLVTSVEFDSDSPGMLIGGYRFKNLNSPLDLPAGFHGTIVSEGFTDLDPVGSILYVDADPGPCSLSFVGSRRDLAGAFPAAQPVASTVAFTAGSFEFTPQETLPPGPGGIAYQIPAGTVGNQNHSGPLGHDFTVQHPISVTRLGVFDSGSDGLFLTISARLYDRDTRQVVASADFSPEDPGELVDGSRFKTLAAPIILQPGFHGTMVASGYGDAELNGNSGGAFPPAWTTHDGGCLISFTGGARYGPAATPGVFPDIRDGGAVNRYAAGTFEFGPADVNGKIFRRGDVDSSGVLDISDPINSLTYQFLGAFSPTCKDALDDDDSGVIDISDPIFSLTRQFLGGPEQPAPGPLTCGADPTADENGLDLGCDVYSASCQ